ncbi:galactan 1,3-beta-galactosidase [Rhizoctonia solani AG-1 IA]|uniref:Galactan 1,3-beta-galactosidase n=1 Tax=Thanatephorus cucumeris (strain AG1-IA) TaxID=983506 RepID=L8WNU1_THACA|nr:galactan 1,3-beta-galactosidase [Rhizoctonia solani AG-1 IA]
MTSTRNNSRHSSPFLALTMKRPANTVLLSVPNHTFGNPEVLQREQNIMKAGTPGCGIPAPAPMRAAFLLPALLASFAVARPLANPNATRYDAIVPGADWRDTDGVLIQAHGGAMVRTDDGTFYWFGEDHRPGGTHFTGIAVYSSKDLYNWKNEGLAFKPVEGTPAASDQVGERPKVVYSERTKTLIYHLAYPVRISACMSTMIVGLVDPANVLLIIHLRFIHTDIAYALYGSRGNNAITRLRDDRLNVSEIIYSFSGTNLEAPGMFKENGTYYHIFSQKTGYRPNNAQLFTAPALTGPWTRQPQLAPEGTNTWESQNTFELKIKGTKKTTHIFMGDRWDRDELSDSRYMWLPITIGGKQAASLEWHDIWKIDVNTGTCLAHLLAEPRMRPRRASLLAVQMLRAAQHVLAGIMLLAVSHQFVDLQWWPHGFPLVTSNSSVTITNIQGTGKPQWLAIYYVNTDVQTTALHRYAGVSVNGAAPEVVKQRTTAEGVVVSVPLQVQFAKGSKNNVTISGVTGRRKSPFSSKETLPHAIVDSRKRMVGQKEHASAMVNQNEIVTTPVSL